MSTFRYTALRHPSNLRIITLHPGEPHDDISISLTETKFDKNNPPYYEALSYVWGPKDNPLPVFVKDEQPIPKAEDVTSASPQLSRTGTPDWIMVTQNLAVALVHLRSKTDARTFWIDALSINQADDEEKGPQVAMMGQIFCHAFRVIAWLGPEESGSSRAMERMGYIGSQIIVDWNTLTVTRAPNCDKSNIVDATAEELPLSSDDVEATYHLVARPWFDRLWIRQEIHLANCQAAIMCGSSELLWTAFRRALAWLYSKMDDLSSVFEPMFNKLLSMQGLIYQSSDMPILDIRQRFGNAQCQDPRDRIFAILEMLSEDDREACPSPDYNSPVEEVYRRVVEGHLRKFRSLEILRECEMDAPSAGPSWVPDWSREATASLSNRPLMASSRLCAWYEFPRDGVLKIAGAARVTTVVEAQNIDITPQRWLNEIYECLHGLLTGISFSAEYVNGDSVLEAYARTFLCDLYYDQADAGSVSLKATMEIIEAIQSTSQFDPVKFRPGTPGLQLLTQFAHFRQKKFMRCGDGHIGIAPPATLPGDKVCVLLGCNATMVLRPTGDGRYLVVGECFVYGLSKGEALLGPLPKSVRFARIWGERSGSWALGFVDGSTSTVSHVDPRLEGLPLSVEELEQYQQDVKKWPTFRLNLSLERLQSLGVGIRYFDLV